MAPIRAGHVHDHLVAHVVQYLAAIIDHHIRQDAEGLVEEAMDFEAVELFSQPRRARNIDKQHEAVFRDGRMIAAGGEIEERARADDVDHRHHEIHQHRERCTKNDRRDEISPLRVRCPPHEMRAEFEILDHQDHRRVDDAADEQARSE